MYYYNTIIMIIVFYKHTIIMIIVFYKHTHTIIMIIKFLESQPPQNSHRKFSFALKHVNARREITKSSFFEDLGLRIEIWRSGGLEFKWNFDPDPLEIVPDLKTSCLGSCAGVISPQNMYNHVQKRTENQNVPVPEMGRRKRWWAHTLWGKSYTQELSF